MGKRRPSVPRPVKRAEYTLQFGTRQAEKGWADLLGTTRNAVVDAWDFLTRTPHRASERNHPMKAELAKVERNGALHDRWQYELPGGARIWFYVEGQTVWLVDVHTRHPNQTK
ncbi:hypothetical protein [Blastococcus sp. CCUG 61487]|uniref:hypothetical protein n=1 Tax=Blastococcus sp. CCUG 61487 TaxID=1840703 RepID=UPI0010C01B45|nr:hypothetical protein [Blastococcus sp. CCUG 61487]TKJ29458.1 hypothetical protein A6V29_19390 [Blastococcus sp. CCUG 61487]